MAAALAFAARYIPALALIAAALLGVVVIRQQVALNALEDKHATVQAQLVQCQQHTAAIQAEGDALQARAAQAIAEAKQARQRAAKARAARAAAPLAQTCDAAIVELSDAMRGEQ